MAKSHDDVQLLGLWASPFTMRVKMALNLKSIDHEFIEEKFYISKIKSELLIHANPVYKKIPVLFHGQKPLCESHFIIEYIDETWTDGPSILPPSDPYNRAMARFWATYIDHTWFPQMKGLQKPLEDESRATCVEKILESTALLEEAFVKCGKGGAYFGGDNIGYLDFVLGSYLGYFKVIELVGGLNLLDKTRFPGLAGWAESLRSHDAAKDVVPETQKMMDYYMEIQASRNSSG